MARVPIGKVQGYVLVYKPDVQMFVLEDGRGDELARGKTQAEVEEKAKKLRKASIGMPVAVIKIGVDSVIKARVTSYNHDSGEFWVVDEKGNREKSGRWRGQEYYEDNDENRVLMAKIIDNDTKRRELDNARKEIVGQLTGRISAKYFEEKVNPGGQDA